MMKKAYTSRTKRWVSLFATMLCIGVLIVGIFPATIFAAEVSGHGVSGLSVNYEDTSQNTSSYAAAAWSAGSNSLSWSDTTGYKWGLFSSTYYFKATKLTLTNTSNEGKTLSFDYNVTLNGGQVKVGTEAIDGAKEYSTFLGAGESLTITTQTHVGAKNTTSVSITNIKLATEAVTITFAAPDAALGSYTVNGTAVISNREITGVSTDSYALVAAPATNYVFAGWYLDGNLISTAATFSNAVFAKSGTLSAEFVIDPLYNIATATGTEAKEDLITVNTQHFHDTNNAFTENSGRSDNSYVGYHSLTGTNGKAGALSTQYVPSLTWKASDGKVVASASGTATGEYEDSYSSRSWAYVNMVTDVIQIYAKQNCVIGFTYTNTASGGDATVALHYLESASNMETIDRVFSAGSTDTSGSFEYVLSAGQYLYIYANGYQSASALFGAEATINYTYNATISNFTVKENIALNTMTSTVQDNTGVALSGGSLVVNGATYSVNGNGKLVDAAGAVAALEYPLGQSMSLSVAGTPANYVFLGWRINGSNSLICTPTYQYTLSADITVDPIFAPKEVTYDAATGVYTYLDVNGNSVTQNGQYVARNHACTAFYTSLTDAFAADGEVILLGNMTIKGNFEIPSGEVLVVPCGMSEVFTIKDDVYQPILDSSAPGVTTYATLTLDGDMVVNGSLLLSGHQYAPTGGHGCIQSAMNLLGSSTVTVSANSNLYSYGYIDGTGTIVAKGNGGGTSGAVIHEFCDIGSIPHPVVMQSLVEIEKVMPINAYYLYSVRAKTKYEPGAKLEGHLSIQYDSITTASLAIIGPSNSCFVVNSGTVTKYLDATLGQIVIRVDEGSQAATNSFELSLTAKLGMSYTVKLKSAEICLPMANGWRIDVAGDMTVKHGFKLLPGAAVDIKSSGRLEIKDDGYMVFYRLNDYDYRYNNAVDDEHLGYNVTGYPININGFPVYNIENVGSAKLNVDGKLVANGKLYVTESLIAERTDAENSYKNFVHYDKGFNNLTGTGTIEMGTTDTSHSALKEYKVHHYNRDAEMASVSFVSMKGLQADATAEDVNNPEKYATLSGKVKGTKVADGVYTWSADPCAEGHDTTNVVWSTDGNNHWHICNRCGEAVDQANHTPNADDGDCTTAITCSICNTETTPANATHTGGTATCKEKAKCTVCGTAYGELAAHTPGADDGDCTTAVKCTVCGAVTTAANAAHTAGADDGDCTTAVKCVNCNQNAIAANAAHTAGADDGDCTTAVKCTVCGTVTTAAKDAHTPAEDDGDCTTAVKCTVCGTVTTPANTTHTGGTATCQALAVCERCGMSYGENASHTASEAVKENIVDPTCGADGSHDEVVYCHVCGEEMTRTTVVDPATGAHTGGTATCIAQAVCTVCGQSYGEVNGNNHIWDHNCDINCNGCGYTREISHIPGAAATCQAPQTCTVCGVELAAKLACADTNNDHYCDNGCNTKLSECADNDKNHLCDVCSAAMGTHVAAEGKHTCDYCGETVTQCADDDTNHACDVCGATMGTHTAGDGKHTCDYCGETVTQCADGDDANHNCDTCNAPDISDHEFGTEWQYDGTHHWQECACGEKSGEAAHEWSEPTYVFAEDGKSCTGTRTCACGAEDVKIAENDAISSQVTPPTCTEPGSITITANFDNCPGFTTQTTTVPGEPALEHAPKAAVHENVNAPTCGKDGSYDEVVYCDRCSVELSRETKVDAATGAHIPNEDDDDCTTEITCSVCGAVTTEAKAHNWVAGETVLPTCTKGGYTIYTCTGCGQTENRNPVAAKQHSYSAVVTAPTCVASGYTTYTCSACGDSYVDDYTSATGEHNFVDGKCDVCGEAQQKEMFDISFASMTMANSLDMNFAFERNHVEDWTGHYAEIRKTYADGREDVIQTIAFANWKPTTINGIAHYYVTFSGIAAKEMTDKLYVTIYNAAGEAVSNVWTDSVQAQAHRNLDKEGVTELSRTMVVDMLNYGAAAQRKNSYAVDNLANAKLTEEQKGYATQSVSYTDKSIHDGNYRANILMVSNLQFVMAFEGVDQEMHAVVTFTNHKGQAKNITIDGSEFVRSGNYWMIYIEETVIADGRQMINCKVYDGETLMTEVTDSIASYAARAASGANGYLYDALMKFSSSAYAYLHN